MKWGCIMGCGQSKSLNKNTGDDPDSNDVYQKSAKALESEKKLSVIATETRTGKGGDNISHTNGGFHDRTSVGGKMDGGIGSIKPRSNSGPLQPQNTNNLCTPGMPSKQVTASQLEFFKMLDEKIEMGKDVTPDEERLSEYS